MRHFQFSKRFKNKMDIISIQHNFWNWLKRYFNDVVARIMASSFIVIMNKDCSLLQLINRLSSWEAQLGIPSRPLYRGALDGTPATLCQCWGQEWLNLCVSSTLCRYDLGNHLERELHGTIYDWEQNEWFEWLVLNLFNLYAVNSQVRGFPTNRYSRPIPCQ